METPMPSLKTIWRSPYSLCKRMKLKSNWIRLMMSRQKPQKSLWWRLIHQMIFQTTLTNQSISKLNFKPTKRGLRVICHLPWLRWKTLCIWTNTTSSPSSTTTTRRTAFIPLSTNVRSILMIMECLEMKMEKKFTMNWDANLIKSTLTSIPWALLKDKVISTMSTLMKISSRTKENCHLTIRPLKWSMTKLDRFKPYWRLKFQRWCLEPKANLEDQRLERSLSINLLRVSSLSIRSIQWEECKDLSKVIYPWEESSFPQKTETWC